jgi:hypothetical protein
MVLVASSVRWWAASRWLLVLPRHSSHLFAHDAATILEGNWQWCRDADGRFTERVYDHVVNSVGRFEVHMGPRNEFAMFKGVQDDHREHTTADNLLNPSSVPMESGRATQRWEVPSLGVALTVTLAAVLGPTVKAGSLSSNP